MFLVLMRHGIAQELGEMVSSPGEAWPRDEMRSLTELGRKRVRRAGLGLRRIGFRADAIISSDLVRARQTAELVARCIVRRSARAGFRPTESSALRPSAHPAEFVKLLPTLRDCASLLAVGHLPHLDRLVALLLGSPDRQLTSFGKAGALALEVPTSGRAAGLLRWYLPPRLLRRLGEAADA